MRLLPNEPAGNWLTPYFYIMEQARPCCGRRRLGDAIQDCLVSGYEKECVEYARDMAAVESGGRSFNAIAKRRAGGAEGVPA